MSQREQSEQIEEQIEETRHQLGETVDELQQRLSPDTLLDDAINYVKTNKEFRRRVLTTVRDNPIPICLIGIGAAWLALSGTSGTNRRRVGGEGEPKESFDAAPLAGDPRFADHPEGPSPQPYPGGETAPSSGRGRAKQ